MNFDAKVQQKIGIRKRKHKKIALHLRISKKSSTFAVAKV